MLVFFNSGMSSQEISPAFPVGVRDLGIKEILSHCVEAVTTV